jgi:hypothetical protein
MTQLRQTDQQQAQQTAARGAEAQHSPRAKSSAEGGQASRAEEAGYEARWRELMGSLQPLAAALPQRPARHESGQLPLFNETLHQKGAAP